MNLIIMVMCLGVSTNVLVANNITTHQWLENQWRVRALQADAQMRSLASKLDKHDMDAICMYRAQLAYRIHLDPKIKFSLINQDILSGFIRIGLPIFGGEKEFVLVSYTYLGTHLLAAAIETMQSDAFVAFDPEDIGTFTINYKQCAFKFSIKNPFVLTSSFSGI